MTDILKALCMIDGTSGDEKAVRDFIIEEIKDRCEYKVDNLGNIIAFKKGKKTPSKKVMIDAHLDEVGLIITSVTSDGFLRFTTVGGINTEVLLCRKVLINGSIPGVIGMRPVHLCQGDSGKKLPNKDNLYIDIGAKDKAEALNTVCLGDRAVIVGDYYQNGDFILSKALDDRVGCAVLCKLLKEDSEYDFYASFSTQEEVGLRGARVSAFSIEPDAAIVLEGTTAADISGVPNDKKVCVLGGGVAVSFMDGTTVYDREYYNLALNSGLNVQVKSAVAGGNDSGAIHLSKSGVRTVTLSVPCRYIHSNSSVCNINDIYAQKDLAKYMLKTVCEEI